MKERTAAQKWLSAAVILLALASASCGEAAREDPSVQASDSRLDSVSEPAPETEEESSGTQHDKIPEPDIPEMDFGGDSYRILGYDTCIFTEGLNGEVINDAVFNRNLQTESRFNLKIEMVMPSDSIDRELSKLVMGGETTIDLAYGTATNLGDVLTFGYARDLKELPYMDFTKLYWYPLAVEGLSCYNRLFMTPSDITVDAMELTYVVYFNKRILGEYDMEDPYRLVDENRWTLSQFLSMIRQVSKDLNGDGVMDKSDLYGIGTFEGRRVGNFMNLLIGTGQFITTQGPDGERVISLDGTRVQSLIDTVGAVLKDGSVALDNMHYLASEGWSNQESSPFFAEGHELFRQAAIQDMQTILREMQDDFGVLPNPKLDEEQESYYHRAHPFTGMFVVPSTIPDPERAGAVFTYMTWLSNRMVLPAFYDVTIKQKRTRDPDAERMLDLVRDTVYYDFSDVYDTHIPDYVWNAYAAGSYSRVFESSLKKMNKTLSRIMDKLKDLES
ncbi:MAG: hypothetical protein J5494_01965 [Candidatus Methanomethylophilaceae archaeon]|nr:hypothetical protein [Candidatus Methanomethylophilaceae archaeon]